MPSKSSVYAGEDADSMECEKESGELRCGARTRAGLKLQLECAGGAIFGHRVVRWEKWAGPRSQSHFPPTDQGGSPKVNRYRPQRPAEAEGTQPAPSRLGPLASGPASQRAFSPPEAGPSQRPDQARSGPAQRPAEPPPGGRPVVALTFVVWDSNLDVVRSSTWDRSIYCRRICLRSAAA